MATTVKIMNWNLQQYGGKRSLREEIVELIASVIALQDIDILALMELNTTQPNVAITVLKALCSKISSEYLRLHSKKQDYNFTFSPARGKETNAYIYKDSISACVLDNKNNDEYEDLTKLKFKSVKKSTSYTPYGDSSENVLDDYFPIISKPQNGHWCGERRPCFGAFQVATNTYLIIISLHNAATLIQAGGNLNLLCKFAVVSSDISLNIDNKTVKSGEQVITGDFNVDYTIEKLRKKYYKGLKDINFAIAVDENTKTFLHNYEPNAYYENSLFLRSANFDNFFILKLNGSNTAVVDIPLMLINNRTAYCRVIEKSHLNNKNGIIALVKGLIYDAINTFFDKKDLRIAGLAKTVENANITFDGLDDNDWILLKKICNDDEIFQELQNQIWNIVEDSKLVYNRFNNLVINSLYKLKLPDSLLLARQLSDHLPVVTTITI